MKLDGDILRACDELAHSVVSLPTEPISIPALRPEDWGLGLLAPVSLSDSVILRGTDYPRQLMANL